MNDFKQYIGVQTPHGPSLRPVNPYKPFLKLYGEKSHTTMHNPAFDIFERFADAHTFLCDGAEIGRVYELDEVELWQQGIDDIFTVLWVDLPSPYFKEDFEDMIRAEPEKWRFVYRLKAKSGFSLTHYECRIDNGKNWLCPIFKNWTKEIMRLISSNTFQCDEAEPGKVYPVEDVDGPVWQLKKPEGDWFNLTDEEYKIYKRDVYRHLNLVFRRVYRLKSKATEQTEGNEFNPRIDILTNGLGDISFDDFLSLVYEFLPATAAPKISEQILLRLRYKGYTIKQATT